VCNRIFPYTVIRGHIQIYGLAQLLLLINLIRVAPVISRFTPFDVSPQNHPFYQKSSLQSSLPEVNCASLRSMRVMALCRQRHRQLNALHQRSYLRPRLMLKMTLTMTSEVNETKTAQLTTIMVIVNPNILTRTVWTWRFKTSSCWEYCCKTTPSGKPNKDSNGNGWRPNSNVWLRNGINGLPTAPNALNETSQSKVRMSTSWLTLYSTAALPKCRTDFWMCYTQISTPTATCYHTVDPIVSNTRSLRRTSGEISNTRLTDRRRCETHPNGRATYLRNPAHAYRASTSFHRR